MADLISAAEAATRLGVKPATLYSYVSRGVLHRRRAADGRSSLFDAGEVESLARHGRPRGRSTSGELVIESRITQIAGDQLRFRGFDAGELAVRCRFEDVAELLWTGALPGRGEASTARPATWPEGAGQAAPPPDAAGRAGAPREEARRADTPPDEPWRSAQIGRAAATAAQAVLPAGTLPLERLQVIVPALAATDPLRLQLTAAAVMAVGRNIIAGMVDCLPPAGAADSASSGGASAVVAAGGSAAGDREPAGSGSIAARLWGRLCPGPPDSGLLAALQSALVLLADHELAASTFAARVAASVRADPYAVVATGLGAVGGALHGGASLGAEVMLAAADGPADAPRVVGDLLRRGERIPGFGHFVYTSADPRAEFLLAALRRAAPGSQQLAVAEAVLAEAAGRGLPQPNIDFALAVLTSVAGMPHGAGEAVFAVARTAGWLAHALEAYAEGTPLRPRAVYAGEAGQARESEPGRAAFP
jgi:citrate synthase